MKSKDTKKNPKNKNEPKEIKIEDTEDKKIPEKEKEKNLERFIHITTYSDIETLKRLKQLFEEVNQSAFSLRSPKEIYTRELSEEERNNNEIDYISGFQLLDKKLRITMIEGITGKAINKVKEYLPRNQMNNNTFKIFSDSNVLFNKRIFSKFELKLKFIKLRNTLEEILTTYDIYTKADRYREIYNAFLNFGSILKSRTMKEIAHANLFSTDDDLLILERKYADILNEEDLTGIKKTKKKRRKISVEEFDKTLLSKTIINNNTSEVNKEKINNEEEKEKVSLKSKLDSHNILFDEHLKKKKKMKVSFSQRMIMNKNDLSIIKKKIEDGIIPKMEKFCSKDNENISKKPIYFYSSVKNNYYVKLVNSMSQKYIHNKKNSYAYSSQLSSFFPLVEPYRNEQYIEHIENKKKWSCDKDFNRFSQPTREKFYFPKIKNFL
jgi:hypothetical protein